MLVSGLAHFSTLKMEAIFSSEKSATSPGRHDVIFQKIKRFITTAVITSNPA
jgi:hypothetical protein